MAVTSHWAALAGRSDSISLASDREVVFEVYGGVTGRCDACKRNDWAGWVDIARGLEDVKVGSFTTERASTWALCNNDPMGGDGL